MNRLIVAAVVMSFIAFGLPRQALSVEIDVRAEARLEVEKAALHYRLGRFEEALQAYTRAYELFTAPVLLFNIGQCHKNLKHYERAIFFFQGYLREETNPQKRALAEELIARSRADLERQRLEAVPPPVAPAPLLVTPPAAPAATDATAITRAAEPSTATPLTRKRWFWAAVGAGALVLVGGTIAYYATGQTTSVPPSGSVGTLDRR